MLKHGLLRYKVSEIKWKESCKKKTLIWMSHDADKSRKDEDLKIEMESQQVKVYW